MANSFNQTQAIPQANEFKQRYRGWLLIVSSYQEIQPFTYSIIECLDQIVNRVISLLTTVMHIGIGNKTDRNFKEKKFRKSFDAKRNELVRAES